MPLDLGDDNLIDGCSLIAAAYRCQADALEIDAHAKRRLADEYDAAQERGEVIGPKGGGGFGAKSFTVPNRHSAVAADIGLTNKAVQAAREVREATEQRHIRNGLVDLPKW